MTVRPHGATNPLQWFAPVPARRLELVRIATFGYAAAWLLVRFRYIDDVAHLPERRFDPIGVLAALDAPPERWVVLLTWTVALASCAAAACGRIVRVAAPVGALGLLLVITLTSSYGQVFHTEHLLVLHVGVLAAAALIERPSDSPSGWPLNLMMAVTVVTYVDAGVAKLRWSGLDWVAGDVLRNWIAVDNLRKWQVDDVYSPLGGLLAGVTWVWFPIALLTLAVELAAPVALLPKRTRLVWISLAWGFHVGILALMAISFPYQLLGVAYVAFLPMETWEANLRGLWRRRSGRRSGAFSTP
jgi:hypothetical protein